MRFSMFVLYNFSYSVFILGYLCQLKPYLNQVLLVTQKNYESGFQWGRVDNAVALEDQNESFLVMSYCDNAY